LGYKRTMTQYSSTAPNAALSAAARILAVNYEGDNTTITLKFKQEPGVVAEQLSVTQALAAEAKNANVFIAYENGTNILEQGVMASGDFVDVITGADWLATTIQRDVWNLFYSSNTKIPQTDDGANLVQATVEARCGQAVANGLAAPGVWNAGGFGTLTQGDFLAKGFYVYIMPMRLQPQADRAARKCPPIQVAIKLAGAMHSADITININQ
jgi:sulfur carrier protein ThiS